MKKKLYFLGALACLNLSLSNEALQAQSFNLIENSITAPVGTNTRTVSVQATGFGGSGTYNWTVSPSPTYTPVYSQNNDRTVSITFDAADVGQTYTITATRGSTSYSETIDIKPSDFWYALGSGNINAADRGIYAMAMSNGSLNAAPTKLASITNAFAALGRGPYPSIPAGYFYYIPNTSSNNGKFDFIGVNGDGSGSEVTLLSNEDINGTSNSSAGFVRLAISIDNKAWMLASSGSSKILARVNLLPTLAGTPTFDIVDDDISLVDGSSNFQNGDLCLDAHGNIYVLANTNSNGSYITEIYIGSPNGTNTSLTKKWEILNSSGNAFTGSVNGCAFDQYGGMYLSTTDNNDPLNDGIYYLEPSTVQNTSSTGFATINALKVFTGSGITDLGTNVWPNYTVLPLKYGAISLNELNGDLNLKWDVYDEENVKEYQIELSNDGKAFTKIGSENALNLKQKHSYNFRYSDPSLSAKVYLRIAGIDFDGKKTYSKVMMLNLNKNEAQLSIYPNPSSNNCTLMVSSATETQSAYTILDATGRVIVKRNISLNKGNNSFDISELTRVLRTGNYYIGMENADVVSYVKLSKL